MSGGPFDSHFHYGRPGITEGIGLVLLGAAMFAWRVAHPLVKRLGHLR